MKLIDTCVYVEVLRGTPTGNLLKSLIPPPGQLLVSTMVLYELGKWLARNMGAEEADEFIAAMLTAQVIEPTAGIALLAAELSANHQLHALDALIYATALEHDAQLVTCDAHFKGLPGVEYTPKVTS